MELIFFVPRLSGDRRVATHRLTRATSIVCIAQQNARRIVAHVFVPALVIAVLLPLTSAVVGRKILPCEHFTIGFHASRWGNINVVFWSLVEAITL
jgi:hypothetical protein